MLISPQISKKKNKTATTIRSQSHPVKAQGAIKTSTRPWSTASNIRWASTSKLWNRKKKTCEISKKNKSKFNRTHWF